MLEGTNIVRDQHNFVITSDQFRGDTIDFDSDAVPAMPPLATGNLRYDYNNGIVLNSSLYYFQRLRKPLEFYFQLNIPLRTGSNPNFKRFVIKNINSSFFSAGGYLVEMTCPELLTSPIHFLDSNSTATEYTQRVHGSLSTQNVIFTIRLISGGVPLAIAYTTKSPDDPVNDTTNPYIPDFIGGLKYNQFLANPSIGFSMIFEYY